MRNKLLTVEVETLLSTLHEDSTRIKDVVWWTWWDNFRLTKLF